MTLAGHLEPHQEAAAMASRAESGSLGAGITSEEAAARLNEFGPNDPVPTKQRGWIREILPLLINPLAGILLAASAISAVAGEVTSAITIAAIVVLGAAINFVQTRRSKIAIDRLRSGVALFAGVLIPFTPLGRYFGFVPLPWTYFLFLFAATMTYLLLLELGKRRLTRGLFAQAAKAA